MMQNLVKELAALKQLSIPELRDRFAYLFGHETRTGNKAWLVKRLGWRLQVLAEGDVSERARRRAEELADDADIRVTAPRAPRTPAGSVAGAKLAASSDGRLPMPGSVITRQYKGQMLEVRV